MKAYEFERTVIETVVIVAEAEPEARQVARAGDGDVTHRTVLAGIWLKGQQDVQP